MSAIGATRKVYIIRTAGGVYSSNKTITWRALTEAAQRKLLQLYRARKIDDNELVILMSKAVKDITQMSEDRGSGELGTNADKSFLLVQLRNITTLNELIQQNQSRMANFGNRYDKHRKQKRQNYNVLF